jgi:hypothetical protein
VPEFTVVNLNSGLQQSCWGTLTEWSAPLRGGGSLLPSRHDLTLFTLIMAHVLTAPRFSRAVHALEPRQLTWGTQETAADMGNPGSAADMGSLGSAAVTPPPTQWRHTPVLLLS